MNKNKPLLIALDMDGTLLNNKKEISLKTLLILRKLARKGHKIILSSGRPVRCLEKYYKQLRLDTPMICYNGEYCFSPTDKNFKPYTYLLNKDMVVGIINKLKDNIISIMCETHDEIFIDEEDMFLDRFFKYEGMNVHKGNVAETLDKDVITFICKIHPEFIDSPLVDELIKPYKNVFCIYWTSSPYFEIHHRDVHKGKGIKYIADYYNIPKENIIAFGDSTNDIEMFDEAGISVLMSNSYKEIKNANMKSLKDNNHDGIYYTLKKILKNKD